MPWLVCAWLSPFSTILSSECSRFWLYTCRRTHITWWMTIDEVSPQVPMLLWLWNVPWLGIKTNWEWTDPMTLSESKYRTSNRFQPRRIVISRPAFILDDHVHANPFWRLCCQLSTFRILIFLFYIIILYIRVYIDHFMLLRERWCIVDVQWFSEKIFHSLVWEKPLRSCQSVSKCILYISHFLRKEVNRKKEKELCPLNYIRAVHSVDLRCIFVLSIH